MRVLLRPVLVPELGLVVLKPGRESIQIFHNPRVLVEPEPKSMRNLPSGVVPAVRQPLAEDKTLLPFFSNERVIRAAGGVGALSDWLLRHVTSCQWPNGDYHHTETVIHRYGTGAMVLCWHCDNQLRDQTSESLELLAQQNLTAWVIDVIRHAISGTQERELSLAELSWWAVCNQVVDALPEAVSRRSLGLPAEKICSVYRESDIVPGEQTATSILKQRTKNLAPLPYAHQQQKSPQEKTVVSITVDPESPESFMKLPKRRRWVNEKYTRWVKTQPCACCGMPADDPHHLIGHGQGGMGTKAHDLFVLPLCRKHHNELHTDTVAFEDKYGSQLELIFRFIDRALTIGVLTYWRKWRTSMNLEALPKYYSPKSPKLSDDAPATGTGCLTITDVMAAQGMVQSKAPLGLALFLAKVGVQDPQFAIEGLLNYAMALDNPTLNKLSEEIRLQIIPYLVSFAFADYSRSAASKARCEHCSGTGFYNVLREVVKHYRRGESVIKEEWVKELCQHCHGKGEASTACRGCKGKGIVLDEKRTRFHGVPVYKICGRCNGNRFSRLPTTLARRHVQKLVPDLTDYQWYKGYADVIGKLVTKCWQEEAYAEAQLRKVTR